MNAVDYFLQHLHTALDQGDLPEATGAIEALDLYPEPWTSEQEAAYAWLSKIHHDMVAAS